VNVKKQEIKCKIFTNQKQALGVGGEPAPGRAAKGRAQGPQAGK
jgi:hypothetical protein